MALWYYWGHCWLKSIRNGNKLIKQVCSHPVGRNVIFNLVLIMWSIFPNPVSKHDDFWGSFTSKINLWRLFAGTWQWRDNHREPRSVPRESGGVRVSGASGSGNHSGSRLLYWEDYEYVLGKRSCSHNAVKTLVELCIFSYSVCVFVWFFSVGLEPKRNQTRTLFTVCLWNNGLFNSPN